MLLDAGIESFLEHRRLRGLAPASLDLYRRWLTFWSRWRADRDLPPEVGGVGIEELRAFFAYLRDEHVPHLSNSHRPAADRVGLSPSSIEGCYRTLRALWRFLDDEEVLTPAQARYFTRDRIPRPQVPDDARDAADEMLLAALLATIDGDDEKAARDRAVILLLFESGMRVSELCALSDRDVRIATGEAKVLGKGQKFRWCFWGRRAATALAAYLRLRRGPVGGPLIRGCSSRNNGNAMTRDAVRAMLKRLAVEAGVELPEGAPVHTFRHGFVHAALDAGLDLSEVAQLAGHRDVKTTMIYARRNRQRLGSAHRRIFDRNQKSGENHDDGPDSRRQRGGAAADRGDS